MKIKSLPLKDLPKPLSILKLVGPSFIILGMGLGSGELILWPYMTSKYGMGIIWGALLGITFQFFMNMEIERYTLAHGESIFVGFARKSRFLPFWFILSTFVPWMWPGLIAASAQLFGSLFGVTSTKYLAIIFLIIIGVLLSLGKTLYKTVETFQKILICIGVPAIIILTMLLAKPIHWEALLNGVVGIGNGYRFLPDGIALATFLGALAYAGAGGNLNLSQSFYVKEKGYGMGKYAGKISGLLNGKKQTIELTGNKFAPTKENIKKFNSWWKNINIEHSLIFWFLGATTIIFLALLSYATTYGNSTTAGINFVIQEGKVIGNLLFPLAGVFFIVVAGSMLFGTQLTILDATSRMLTENVLLAKGSRTAHVSKMYYTILWAQITAGIIIFMSGFTEPMQLIIIAAVLNALAMFVHSGLTLWTNMTLLDKQIRPSKFRFSVMTMAFLFYGGFGAYTLINYFL